MSNCEKQISKWDDADLNKQKVKYKVISCLHILNKPHGGEL